MQIDAERLLDLATSAFPDYALNEQNRVLETQLIDFFVDGLMKDKIKIKLMRDARTILENAISIAANEQRLYKRFDFRLVKRAVDEKFQSRHRHNSSVRRE